MGHLFPSGTSIGVSGVEVGRIQYDEITQQILHLRKRRVQCTGPWTDSPLSVLFEL
jgi:hypothetical protein